MTKIATTALSIEGLQKRAENLKVKAADTIAIEKLAQEEVIIEAGLTAYRAVGTALRVIKKGGLYRAAGYKSFPENLKQRWSISKAYAHNLMDAAELAEQIEERGLLVPVNEAQCRKLKLADQSSRVNVWEQLLAKYDRQPTGPEIETFLTTGQPKETSSNEDAEAKTGQEVAATQDQPTGEEQPQVGHETETNDFANVDEYLAKADKLVSRIVEDYESQLFHYLSENGLRPKEGFQLRPAVEAMFAEILRHCEPVA